jgi:maltose/maltodextrin transport system substrate-binding protein
MKRFFYAAALAVILFAGCKPVCEYEALNARAAEEYLQPIRPGYEGRNPFWNKFATKFIYAPAFDFPAVEGATAYKFTVKPQDEAGTAVWSFTASEPTASLAPIWNEIPPCKVALIVEAVDAEGNVIQTVGERMFL